MLVNVIVGVCVVIDIMRIVAVQHIVKGSRTRRSGAASSRDFLLSQ